MFSNRINFLPDSYDAACQQSYSYLLIDLRAETPNYIRLRGESWTKTATISMREQTVNWKATAWTVHCFNWWLEHKMRRVKLHLPLLKYLVYGKPGMSVDFGWKLRTHKSYVWMRKLHQIKKQLRTLADKKFQWTRRNVRFETGGF